MSSLISEVSKYLMIIMAALYTFLGFRVLATADRKERAALYGTEGVLIFLYHFTGFFSVWFYYKQNLKILTLYLAQVILIIAALLLYRSIYRRFSTILFMHMLFLLTTGFIFITRLDADAAIKQTLFSGFAMLVGLFIPFMIKKAKFLRKVGFIYGFLGIGALLYVLVKGEVHYGAKNWVTVFNRFTLQPSEFVKILLIFMIASMLYVSTNIMSVLAITGLSGIMVLMLVAGKDLGAALLFFSTYAIMLWCGTHNKKFIALLCGGGIVGSIAGYFLFAHVRVRVEAFLDPWSHISDSGYQVAQSLFGIGTGGWFGFGIGNGNPKLTPVVSSDFIFSALCEEQGLLFGFCIILIYLCTFLIMINIAWRIKNTFHQLLSIGCCVMYSIQIFLCIGGAIKMLPSTGVTLPLISYGGSSIISTIIIFSIIQGLYVANNDENKETFYEKEAPKKRRGRRADRAEPDRYATGIKRPVGLTYVFSAFFVCMIGYLTFFQFVTTPKVINSAYNKRLDLYANTISRGKILSADGRVLAYTKENKDGSSTRVYPYTDIYSHVVGRNSNGKTGIEALMNYQLFTSNDNIIKRVQERFSGEKNTGDTVVSTLDSDLQKALDAAMTGYPGAGVILEPSTGKVLALVSKPDYDPNTVSRDWEELMSLKGKDSKLLNRAVNGLYPPGSTFKILTSLEYMEEHGTYKDFSFDCTGSFSRGKYKIKCYDNKAHGSEDLTAAFANSCNSAFSSIGIKLNLNSFHKLAETFMFNENLPFPITANMSSFSLKDGANADEIMQTAIGQGKTQISPVHNAMIAAAIANDGIVMKPYLVDRVTSCDGSYTVKQYKPEAYRKVCSEKEARVLKKFMRAVVTDGTAKKLSWLGYDIYGKTGTAEYNSVNGEKLDHSWFTGFGEKNGRTIAIGVVLEGENRGSYTGTDVAYKVFESFKN